MTKTYREHMEELVELARQCQNPEQRYQLLRVAQAFQQAAIEWERHDSPTVLRPVEP